MEIGSAFDTPAPLGSILINSVPDFEKIVRIDYGMGGGKSPIIETASNGVGKKTKMKDFVFADSTLFEVFNIPALYGDPETALKKPYSIVLTRTTAVNLFGTENPVGQVIHYIGDNGLPMDMTITAVIEDFPNNSTLSFNAVGSLSSLYSIGRKFGYKIDEDWHNRQYDTFILFKQNDISAVKGKVNNLWTAQEKILDNVHEQINLIPLGDVYFHNNSKRQLILFLQLVGIFVLTLAIINFINLTIAKSSSRALEIGMRKVVGANRNALISQFLSESILISALATVSALIIVELIKTNFYKLIDKQISFGFYNQSPIILMLITGVIVIGIISGIYPAVVLSSFKPTSILKGEITKGRKGNLLRNSLIVFQFAISISLIIGTLLISRQVNYIKNKDLGINKMNVVHFQQSYQLNQSYDVFKQNLLQNPDISYVSRSNTAFGRELPIGLSSMLNGLKKSFSATTVDPDFIPAMGIKMLKGRQFSWDLQSDVNSTAIVNKTFVEEFDLKQPLGTMLDFSNGKVMIIGVMKDFNYNSLHQKIEPAALIYADWNKEINVRIKNHNISGTIQYIKNTWNKMSPDVPFEYEFLDETYDKHYKSDEQFQSIINCFAGVAIIIACLGLLGLVSQSVNRRIKEIGIRKILGASVKSIVFKLSSEYLKWIILANIIAWPLAWYVINSWMENFAYRIDISWWVFVLSGGIALAIALATVSFQAIKAAVANPVESLRYE